MKKDSKKEAKLCFILHTISSVLFTLTGIANIVDKKLITGITGVALGITFGSLAIMYFKKYKAAE